MKFGNCICMYAYTEGLTYTFVWPLSSAWQWDNNQESYLAVSDPSISHPLLAFFAHIRSLIFCSFPTRSNEGLQRLVQENPFLQPSKFWWFVSVTVQKEYNVIFISDLERQLPYFRLFETYGRFQYETSILVLLNIWYFQICLQISRITWSYYLKYTFHLLFISVLSSGLSFEEKGRSHLETADM